jgi:hypothetical protein
MGRTSQSHKCPSAVQVSEDSSRMRLVCKVTSLALRLQIFLFIIFKVCTKEYDLRVAADVRPRQVSFQPIQSALVVRSLRQPGRTCSASCCLAPASAQAGPACMHQTVQAQPMADAGCPHPGVSGHAWSGLQHRSLSETASGRMRRRMCNQPLYVAGSSPWRLCVAK